MKKQKLELDTSKMLGFRLLEAKPQSQRQAPGAKAGIKTTVGRRLGAKAGGKAGAKPV